MTKSKNRLFIFISAIMLIIVFGAAGSCNMCSMNIKEDSSTSATVNVSPEKKETSAENPDEKIVNEDTSVQANDTDGNDKNAEPPTLKLQIYEGPVYSDTDDICYYRIEAIVTGNPTPEVTFSKDDSNGSWGKYKVQINLTEGSPEYTLTASAKNSAGDYTASIDLKWGCGSSDDDTLIGDIDFDTSKKIINKIPILTSANLNTVQNEGGWIEENFMVHPNGDIYIGDSGEELGNPYSGNRICSGFISFDISSLSGFDINSASLILENGQKRSDPDFLGELWIGKIDHGTDEIILSDYHLSGADIQSLSVTSGGSIVYDSDNLKQKLQESVNSGNQRFQIRLYFSATSSDKDDIFDGFYYKQSDIILSIKYSK